MSKVNPEPNIIHIMGCYVLGNPNGEKVGSCGSPLECHTGSSKPASSAGWEGAAVLSVGAGSGRTLCTVGQGRVD